MPCFSASDLTFHFSDINITKLYFTGMKTYQASFKPQWDLEHSTPHPHHPLQNRLWVTLVSSDKIWFLVCIMSHICVLIMANQLIKMNIAVMWLVLFLHYLGCPGVVKAENLRSSIIFLRPFRQMLDE